MDLDNEFESNNFPLDVLWLDIEHTENYRYFKFDPYFFEISDVNRMNDQIAQHQRRLVVITDPHIKDSDDFFVRE
jgi:alpha 1,3-glucosidase